MPVVRRREPRRRPVLRKLRDRALGQVQPLHGRDPDGRPVLPRLWSARGRPDRPRGAEARHGRVRRPRRIPPRSGSASTRNGFARSSRTTSPWSRRRSKPGAAPSRSTSATPLSRSSACHGCTRTTLPGPSAPRPKSPSGSPTSPRSSSAGTASSSPSASGSTPARSSPRPRSTPTGRWSPATRSTWPLASRLPRRSARAGR